MYVKCTYICIQLLVHMQKVSICTYLQMCLNLCFGVKVLLTIIVILYICMYLYISFIIYTHTYTLLTYVCTLYIQTYLNSVDRLFNPQNNFTANFMLLIWIFVYPTLDIGGIRQNFTLKHSLKHKVSNTYKESVILS